MKILKIIKITVSLLSCLLLQLPGVAISQDSDVSAQFNQAYRSYRTLNEEGKLAESLPFAQQALALGKQIYSEENQTTAALSHNYALNLLAVGQFEAAQAEFTRAISAYEKVYGKESEELAAAYFDAGSASALHHRDRRTTALFRNSVEITEKIHGDSSLEYGHMNMQAGVVLLDDGNIRSADDFLERALEIYTRAYGAYNPNTALAEFYLGKLQFSNRRFPRAEAHFLGAVNGLAQAAGPENRQLLLTARAYLVQIYARDDEMAKAVDQLKFISAVAPPSLNNDPVPVYSTLPEYPRAAQTAGSAGFVVVGFDLSAEGRVMNPQVVELEGHASFEEAALAVVGDYLFPPYMASGEPQLQTGLKYRFNFQLTE